MKLLLMGPPACGKGTQGKMLSEKLGIPLISGGALLRAMPESHPRFNEIHSLISQGTLAPQDFLAELLRERTSQPDCANGYILDGWGRQMIDLEYFDPGFDRVLLINVSDETVIKRITGRRLCTSNGKMYNIYTLPEEELAECEGELVQREDDTEEVVKHRLEEQSPKKVVIEYFEKQNNISYIDGEPQPDEIFANILKVLEIE